MKLAHYLRVKARLYQQVFTLGVQNTLVYRWNFFVKAAVGLVPLITTYFVWKAVFHGTSESRIAGYSYPLMMAYYFTLVVLDSFTAPTEDDHQIAVDIRDGRLSQILLKPINYYLYRFAFFVSGRLVYIIAAFIPLALFLYCFRRFFVGIPFQHTLIPALFAFAGSAILQFSIAFMTGLLAFWLLEVTSLVFILMSLEYLLGGHIFPLDLLPQPWQTLARATPFSYEYFFPAAVLTGRITGSALAWGFVWQGFWIAALLGGSLFFWKRGLKHYTAVGG